MLAPIYVSSEVLDDSLASYNPMSVAEAASRYPFLFSQFANGTGLLDNLTAQKVKLVVETSDYFSRAEKLVAGDSVTLDTLKAVLAYQYIAHYADSLSAPFYEASASFFSQTLGGRRHVPRDRRCAFL